MKTFKRFLTPKELAAACKRRRFRYDQEQFERGGDHVAFTFKHGNITAQVTYSTVNGRAFGEFWRGKSAKRHRFSSGSNEHDGAAWFIALLEFIYVA